MDFSVKYANKERYYNFSILAGKGREGIEVYT